MSHLAQVNIAKMKAPLNDPLMAEFKNGLDRINKLADESPGFVWRLQTDEGDATGINAFCDELILINMSVWQTPDHFKEFTYKSQHGYFVKNRKLWFEPYSDLPVYVMWWIEPGMIPTVQEAKRRLEYFRDNGESQYAFTFKSDFKLTQKYLELPTEKPS